MPDKAILFGVNDYQNVPKLRGCVADVDQMLHLRPHNRFEDLDGMYLVGGGTHPGSGLPVIFESARISSRLLLEDLGINTDTPLLRTGLAVHAATAVQSKMAATPLDLNARPAL